ncbi:MAG: LpqN/LpqT family lipoprotein [Mycobacterium sp.]
MAKPNNGRFLVAAAAVTGAVLTGCGSGETAPATPSSSGAAQTSQAESSAAPDTATSAAAPASSVDYTVADYLRDNGITQTPVVRGDAGAPDINLPMPAGWRDVGADTPEDAWGAIVLDDPAVVDPPAIIARVAKLTGNVDAAKILELAPNAVRKQPGFQGSAGTPSQLAGFDAAQIAGTVQTDGTAMFVARKTVVIPGADAVYLLALDAQGTPEQEPALSEAMSVIDAETTIEP